MREILFRGKRVDNGEWITGFLVSAKHIGDWVNAHPIAPETVGQFTGLTDKNGVKIFEGDIVKAPDVTHDGDVQIKGNIFEVRFADGLFYLTRKGGSAFLNRAFEVIGNIHDNPELLTEDTP